MLLTFYYKLHFIKIIFNVPIEISISLIYILGIFRDNIVASSVFT